MNFVIKIAYDGTRYYGWQKTKAGPSIEQELEEVLEKILQQKVKLQAASRTDRGVHALGQLINFQADRCPSLMSLHRLLPSDIAALEIKKVPDNFHATLAPKSKIYRYELTSAPFQIPQRRFYEWHFPANLDLNLMNQAALLLVGKKDFKTLTNRKPTELYKTTVRHVTSIDIIETKKDHYSIIVKGESFLYKMVRNLVGLIVWVGAGKIKLNEVEEILNSKDRKKAGMSAPAHGLTLIEVNLD